jgi:hypothetical protein
MASPLREPSPTDKMSTSTLIERDPDVSFDTTLILLQSTVVNIEHICNVYVTHIVGEIDIRA